MALKKTVGIPVFVVSSKDDHIAAINTALRDAGHPSHCSKVAQVSAIDEALQQEIPDLVVYFGAADSDGLTNLVESMAAADASAPLLLVTDDISEDVIAAAMSRGASDVVSMSNIERLQLVAGRELRAARIEKELDSVMSSANQFKHELNSLKEVSVEAIADIQEGIIVHANPAWLELFAHDETDDMMGTPVMDLCSESDRSALKGAIVACQKGKWNDSELTISGVRGNDEEFSLTFSLVPVEHDGDPAVRVVVAPTAEDQQTPLSLVEQAVQRDQATGLFNQQHFLHVSAQRLEKAPSGGVRAIAYLRPDRFGRARDDIGLLGTESVISQLAQILRELAQPTDIYSRFGGTMFAVMLERGTMSDVEAWAQQLLDSIAEAVFEHDERSTALTGSIGLCEVDAKNSDIASLLNEAEMACRKARQNSGNQLTLSESSGAAKKIRQDDTIWVPRIRGALMENRLRLEHQPIAGLNDDIDGAYDTLVRMLDEDGNTILPSEFMPVAERKGLTKNIDRWVIGASFSFCSANNAKLIFVRLSRDSLLDDTLLPWLNTQIKDAGIDPSQICFEVSEDVAVRHLRQSQGLAEGLRSSGFKFAIEHFGKSESSNRTIEKITMDFAKIDGSLMQGLHKNPATQAKVKELARLARDNAVATIAERVQDANTMAVLWQLGVSFIQGNYVQGSEIVIEDTSQSMMTTQALQLDQMQAAKAAEETAEAET